MVEGDGRLKLEGSRAYGGRIDITYGERTLTGSDSESTKCLEDEDIDDKLHTLRIPLTSQ